MHKEKTKMKEVEAKTDSTERKHRALLIKIGDFNIPYSAISHTE